MLIILIALTTSVAGSWMMPDIPPTTLEFRGTQAMMSINLIEPSCSYHYRGPVHPDYPVNAFIAAGRKSSGEEWESVHLVGEMIIPDRDVCFSHLSWSAPRCGDCVTERSKMLDGEISCTYSQTGRVFNGVTLTYKFKPGTFHAYYIEKRAQLFDWRIMESRSYTSAENHVKDAQASLNRFTPYVPQPRPRGWIDQIVWLATTPKRVRTERQRRMDDETHHQRLRDDLALKEIELNEQQAVRQGKERKLEAERESMEAALAPQICEEMKARVLQRVLPRVVSLRLPAKAQQAEAHHAATLVLPPVASLRPPAKVQQAETHHAASLPLAAKVQEAEALFATTLVEINRRGQLLVDEFARKGIMIRFPASPSQDDRGVCLREEDDGSISLVRPDRTCRITFKKGHFPHLTDWGINLLIKALQTGCFVRSSDVAISHDEPSADRTMVIMDFRPHSWDGTYWPEGDDERGNYTARGCDWLNPQGGYVSSTIYLKKERRASGAPLGLPNMPDEEVPCESLKRVYNLAVGLATIGLGPVVPVAATGIAAHTGMTRDDAMRKSEALIHEFWMNGTMIPSSASNVTSGITIHKREDGTTELIRSGGGCRMTITKGLFPDLKGTARDMFVSAMQTGCFSKRSAPVVSSVKVAESLESDGYTSSRGCSWVLTPPKDDIIHFTYYFTWKEEFAPSFPGVPLPSIYKDERLCDSMIEVYTLADGLAKIWAPFH